MMPSSRYEAIQTAREFLNNAPVFLDTETTGIGPNDNIVEIAIIDTDGQVLFDSLVKPVGKIAPDARAVHGISEGMVASAPSWKEVWSAVEAVLEGRWVGIYNAEFDLRMMQQSHQRHWMPWTSPAGMQPFCIMKLYALFYGEWNPRRRNYRWHSLDRAGQQCQIPLPNSHRAKADALLTREVFLHMAHQAL